MIKNPFLNALCAALYIVAIVLAITFFGEIGGESEDTILIPMTMLSLFVLSALVMAYLFVFEPLRMFLEGKKHEAVTFFFKTVGTFAGFTVLFAIAMLLSL